MWDPKLLLLHNKQTSNPSMFENLIFVMEGDSSSAIYGMNPSSYSGVTANQAGHMNKSYRFDGSNDYMIFNNVGSSVFSISMWLKNGGSDTTYDRMFAHTSYQYDMAKDSSGVLRAYDGGWRATGVTFGSAFNHFVFAKSASSQKIYKNGSLVWTRNAARTVSSTSELYFGRKYSGGEQANFYAEQIGYWHKELLLEDVQYLHNSGAGRLFSNW